MSSGRLLHRGISIGPSRAMSAFPKADITAGLDDHRSLICERDLDLLAGWRDHSLASRSLAAPAGVAGAEPSPSTPVTL